MTNQTEEQILAKLEKISEMLDFTLLQLRDTNLRLTEIIIRLPSSETTSHSAPSPTQKKHQQR
jgi:hypothetical protein